MPTGVPNTYPNTPRPTAAVTEPPTAAAKAAAVEAPPTLAFEAMRRCLVSIRLPPTNKTIACETRITVAITRIPGVDISCLEKRHEAPKAAKNRLRRRFASGVAWINNGCMAVIRDIIKENMVIMARSSPGGR